mgnify:CR=1 FL=1
MRRTMLLAITALAAGSAALSQPVTVQDRRLAEVERGRMLAEARCAACHGRDGKGNGPIADLLRKSPPDLTLLSRSNGGIFPMSRVYDSIIGDDVKAHGSRDMPVWGQVYRLRAGEHYSDTYYDPEAYVRIRVLAVVEYINRLQLANRP